MKMPETYQITHEQFSDIAKYFRHPQDIENIKKPETAGFLYILGYKRSVDIAKIDTNKIKVSLENCTQKVRKDIKKVLGEEKVN